MSNAQFAVHKYFIAVKLLGDISDRSLFRHVVLEKALIAYFNIDKGKIYLPLSLLTTFNSSHQLSAHCSFRTFEDNNTYTLIFRLRQNVIKTGIQRLSLAYSHISLWASLDSEEDAEYFIGKAIQDGVIEGHIVHEKGWMESATPKCVYGPEVSKIFVRLGHEIVVPVECTSGRSDSASN